MTRGRRTLTRKNAFVIVWEFHVRPAKRRAFEAAYGSRGEWVRLFQTGVGYIRTELIRDLKSPARYFTLDYWHSRRDYEVFRSENLGAYESIDERCEPLFTEEAEVGRFTLKS